MGIDFAEVLLVAEDKFHIEIWDDAPKLDTIEDLIDCIEQKTAQAPHCFEEVKQQNQENFDKVKRFLAQELDLPLSQLTPETETASLFKTYSKRRKVWDKMNKVLSRRLPVLEGKFFAECFGGFWYIVGFTFALFVMISSDSTLNGFYGLTMGACGGIILYVLGNRFFLPLFFRIPKECQTLDGLVRSTFRTGISIDTEGKFWSRQAITEFVFEKICNVSDVPVEKLSPSLHLTELLG